MYWTTLPAVLQILQVRPKDKPIIPAIISDAGIMVTNICLCYGANSYQNTIATSGTLATLEQIQRYLTCHIYESVVRRRQLEQSAGKSRQRTAIAINLELNNTHWGQLAMLADINGGLAWWNKAISEGGRIMTSISHLGPAHMPMIALGDIPTYAWG